MITMDCRQAIEQLSNYLDDDIAVETRRAIEEHLRRCHRCTIVFDTARKSLRILSEAEPFEIPLEVSARLYARLRAALPLG